jgi:hypothetical protein
LGNRLRARAGKLSIVIDVAATVTNPWDQNVQGNLVEGAEVMQQGRFNQVGLLDAEGPHILFQPLLGFHRYVR